MSTQREINLHSNKSKESAKKEIKILSVKILCFGEMCCNSLSLEKMINIYHYQ